MVFFISQKKFESEMAKRASDACDQIISEIGAEIHDDLIQRLSILRLYIDRIERSNGDILEIESLAMKMRTDFEQIILTVKNISHRLLPVTIEGDTLINAIELLCQNMSQLGHGHIHFETSGTHKIMNSQVEMYVLRIVQELIHNAFKHSAAWHIWVRLRWSIDELVIEVEDDGSGFSKITEFASKLKKKNNTLKIRTLAIRGSINYLHGTKGLMARLNIPIKG